MLTLIRRFLLLVNLLKATSSRNEKEKILEEYFIDDEIKSIFQFIYDPYIVTGISSKKIQNARYSYNKSLFESTLSVDLSTNDLLAFLDYYKTHNTGTLFDVQYLIWYASRLPEQDGNLLIQIVSKDVKTGIQPTTLNKIYGKNFIRKFDVMLAQKYFDNPEKYLPEGTEYIITTKLDGLRCVCIYDENKPLFFTRQGQLIEGLDDLMFEFRQMPNGHVFDGELLVKNDKNLESKDLYRETVKVVNADGIKKNVIFNCFDIMRIEDFENGICQTPAKERKRILKNLLDKYHYNFIKNVDVLYQGTDQSQIKYWLDKITSEGGEGVMINIADAPYECKRSSKLLKVKKFQDIDLEILNICRGTGKYSNTLGYIECRYKNNIVKVGSGFTDIERDEIFNNSNKYIGKIATIKYFEESSNQQGLNSLRFPTWKGIRIDKGPDI